MEEHVQALRPVYLNFKSLLLFCIFHPSFPTNERKVLIPRKSFFLNLEHWESFLTSFQASARGGGGEREGWQPGRRGALQMARRKVGEEGKN